jgi:DNA-binding response OmpR family regulator
MASKKILILDDDLDILAVMQLLFKTKGFDVVALSRWEEVYEKVDSFKPHLILLDVLLSGNDGRDICRDLKHKQSTRNIPIVMFSANPSAADNIHEYGADDFIHKPFEVNDLLATINKHLQRSAYSA